MQHINKIVSGKVISIHDTHVIVLLDNTKKGLLHISEISDYYVREIDSIFRVGKIYDFIVIEENTGKVKLSWKKINPRYMKNPFKFSLKDTELGSQRLFDNLERNLND